MNAIDAVFSRLRAEKRTALMPFVSAGDPDLGATAALVRELARRGAHLVEIGFPYSDPIADGPVIQASYTRALKKGVRVEDIFRTVRELADVGVPLVGMVSYAVVHRRGPEAFLKQAQEAGFGGAIIPDLPIDEAAGIARLAAGRDFKLIQLVTPTTPRERAAQIAKLSTGFLYVVSTTGITGERDRLPAELTATLAWLREQTSLPLCVGFGISGPEQARPLRGVADGVIVGSAFVRRIEQAATHPLPDVVAEVGSLAESLLAALR
ncbi:MAG TPA: tryptophan synthase subunit alpha [Gemmataceae bacterium]|nr:tryptophan synthase subunit alpha [Gemmataceae bacterium]